MNILYCGDKKIEDGLIISTLSLAKTVSEPLNIYVVTMELTLNGKKFSAVSNEVIRYLDGYLKTKNAQNFVKLIDATNLFNEKIPEKNLETRFTPYCMLRLYADQINELPEKLLYLDNDVICRLDCSEFYNQDITNYEIVGVLDYYGKWFFRNNLFKADYINSGVLLLNLKKIKETKLFEKCRNRCKTNKMFMPDQSAINKLASLKKIEPRKFNEQRKLHQNTVFQHFTTSFRFLPLFHKLTVKPWQVDEVHRKLKIYEYDELFSEYFRVLKEIQGGIKNEQ